MHKYAVEIIGRRQDQVIQPWMFGHAEQKATCLWLKGLPALAPTNNVKQQMMKLPANQRQRLHYLPPSPDRWKERSRTFTGIAEAMAQQWGGNNTHTKQKGGEMSSLGDELPKLMAQMRDELLPAYLSIGAAGAFGAHMIQAELDRATKALAEGDVIEMISCYESLKGME